MKELNKKLTSAIRDNDLSTVEKCLQAGADINETFALRYAVIQGNLDCLALLLEKGQKPTQETFRSALEFVIINGDLSTFKFLVNNGADVNFVEEGAPLQSIPLVTVAANERIDLLRYLVEERGVDVNTTTKNGWNPLMAAAMNGRLEIVKYLLSYGADMDAVDNLKGQSALVAAAEGDSFDCTSLLLQYGADVNVVDKYGKSALYYAIYHCNVENVKRLLEYGANIDDKVREVEAEGPGDLNKKMEIYRMMKRASKIRNAFLREQKKIQKQRKQQQASFEKELSSLSIADKLDCQKNRQIIEQALILGALVDLFKDDRMTWQEQYKLYAQLKPELYKLEHIKEMRSIQNILRQRKQASLQR